MLTESSRHEQHVGVAEREPWNEQFLSVVRLQPRHRAQQTPHSVQSRTCTCCLGATLTLSVPSSARLDRLQQTVVDECSWLNADAKFWRLSCGTVMIRTYTRELLKSHVSQDSRGSRSSGPSPVQFILYIPCAVCLI